MSVYKEPTPAPSPAVWPYPAASTSFLRTHTTATSVAPLFAAWSPPNAQRPLTHSNASALPYAYHQRPPQRAPPHATHNTNDARAPENEGKDEEAALTTDGGGEDGGGTWLRARCACAATMFLPILFLAPSPASTQRAAIVYLLLVPLTAPPLQGFASSGGALTGGLSAACLCLSNLSAVLLLVGSMMMMAPAPPACAPPSPVLTSESLFLQTPQPQPTGAAAAAVAVIAAAPWARLITAAAYELCALSLCLGCAQLLLMIHKGNVLRVMACTAAAVMVAALALSAALSPPATARRFFQTAALPFVLLFLEASRRHPPPPPHRST